VSGTAFTFALACGAPWGERFFTCGPGFAGAEVEVACPSVAVLPVCGFWREGGGEQGSGWAAEGCGVAGWDAASITCACTHLTDFAARFVAVEAEASNAEVFAAPVAVVVLTPARAGLATVVVALLLGSVAAAAAAGAAGDEAAARRAAAALAADPELSFLARADEARLALAAEAEPGGSGRAGSGAPREKPRLPPWAGIVDRLAGGQVRHRW
jgi:hypothetical protein